MKNGKGVTWMDDCRIPYEGQADKKAGWRDWDKHKGFGSHYGGKKLTYRKPANSNGRFPANLICSDDVLNNGRIIKGGGQHSGQKLTIFDNDAGVILPHPELDSGSFSRYFDLDKWAQKTFPFLICSKASKSEKGKDNKHPTVKPLKLMSYLVTLGSRTGDRILDCFCGSGTTGIACKLLNRKYILIDSNIEYCKIAQERIDAKRRQLKMFW